MSIHYDTKLQIFHLQTENTSYVFGLTRGTYPVHLHWGKKIRSSAISDLFDPGAMGFSSTVDPAEPSLSWIHSPMSIRAMVRAISGSPLT